MRINTCSMLPQLASKRSVQADRVHERLRQVGGEARNQQQRLLIQVPQLRPQLLNRTSRDCVGPLTIPIIFRTGHPKFLKSLFPYTPALPKLRQPTAQNDRDRSAGPWTPLFCPTAVWRSSKLPKFKSEPDSAYTVSGVFFQNRGNRGFRREVREERGRSCRGGLLGQTGELP